MNTSRKTRSDTAATIAKDLVADSIEVQVAAAEEEEEEQQQEEEEEEELELGGKENQRDLEARNDNVNEDEDSDGDGDEVTGIGTGTEVQAEERGHQVRGHSTQIERILNSVHQAWNIANINNHLAPAILPPQGVWTERPAKQLSKLARATTVQHREWVLGQLHRCAGDNPLTRSVIEQVYQKAEAEGKVASQRSRATSTGTNSARGASREAVIVPDTPQAQRWQQRQQQQQQQQQRESRSHSWRPSRPSRLAAALSTSTSRRRQRAASSELGDALTTLLSSPSQTPSPSPLRPTPPLHQPRHTERDNEDDECEDALNESGLSESLSRILRDSRDRTDRRNQLNLRALPELPPPHPSNALTSTNTHISPEHPQPTQRADTTIVCASTTASFESQSMHNTDQLRRTEHAMQTESRNAQTASQASGSPRTSSPSATTITSGPSNSKKRTHHSAFSDLLGAAVENRTTELARTRNRIKVLEAKQAEIAFDLENNDADFQSFLARDIPSLEARHAELKSTLLSTQQFLDNCDAAFKTGEAPARQALTECEHEQNPCRASTRRDSVLGVTITPMGEGGRATEMGDLTTTIKPSSLAEDCPACHLARWKATCAIRLGDMKDQLSAVQAKLDEAEADQAKRLHQSQMFKEQINALKDEIEDLKSKIPGMEHAISSLVDLSKTAGE